MVEACRENDNPECRAQWQQAVEVYQAALALEPARTDAHFGLGVVHFLLGESELAIAALEHAHAQAPGAPRISLFLGEAYRLVGKPERASWHLLRTMRWEVEPEWRDKAREAVRLLNPTSR